MTRTTDELEKLMAETNVARRRKALDELIAMDADLYNDPLPEPAQWHAIVIGDFKLCCEGRAPGKVWIETEGGEGGDFPIADIAALIREYYDANF